jgi:hypothetical protein
MNTNRQIFLDNRTAVAAHLGCVSGVDSNQLATSFFHFVCQQLGGRSQPRIVPGIAALIGDLFVQSLSNSTCKHNQSVCRAPNKMICEGVNTIFARFVTTISHRTIVPKSIQLQVYTTKENGLRHLQIPLLPKDGCPLWRILWHSKRFSGCSLLKLAFH